MKRREFITLLGGAAAWPVLARAQQGNRVRRIGVVMAGDENDPVVKAYVSSFTQALAALGWTDGRNVRMDLRWAGGDINRISIENAQLGRLRKWPAIGPPRSVGKCGPTYHRADAAMQNVIDLLVAA